MKQFYGVIGDPISHSLSPILHTIAIEYFSLNASYRSFHVKKSELENTILQMRNNEINGLNVTIPHKINVIPFLDELHSDAKHIGAVNTIVNQNKKLVGENTDWVGLLNAIKNKRINLNQKNTLLIGGGGVAKAVAYACLKSHSSLYIFNRSPKDQWIYKLKTLFPSAKIEFTSKWSIVSEQLHHTDVLINATPLGMTNYPNFKFDISALQKNALVIDTVYSAHGTDLIHWAGKNNHPFVTGVDMLYYQGEAAFKLWTGRSWNTKIYDAFLNYIRKG